MAIHSSESHPHRRNHTGKEVGEVGDRASEGQAAGVYGAGFTAVSRAGKGARGETRLVLTRS